MDDRAIRVAMFDIFRAVGEVIRPQIIKCFVLLRMKIRRTWKWMSVDGLFHGFQSTKVTALKSALRLDTNSREFSFCSL